MVSFLVCADEEPESATLWISDGDLVIGGEEDELIWGPSDAWTESDLDQVVEMSTDVPWSQPSLAAGVDRRLADSAAILETEPPPGFVVDSKLDSVPIRRDDFEARCAS